MEIKKKNICTDRVKDQTRKELWSPGDFMNIDEFRNFDKHCVVLQVTTFTENSENAKDAGGGGRVGVGKWMRNT